MEKGKLSSDKKCPVIKQISALTQGDISALTQGDKER